ncbi:MAG: S-layer homology domain-containing protein [Limnochordia bacterium]|jgi:hypothetical protein
MRKKIALLVALLMVGSLVLPVIAAAANPFSDLPAHHWAYDAVVQLEAAGLVEGYPDGEFKGQRPMTRYEMAMVVARFLAQLDNRVASAIEAERPGIVAEVRDQVSQDLKDELAKALADIEAAKAGVSEEARAELERAQKLIADELAALEASRAEVDGETIVVTPALEQVVREEVERAINERIEKAAEDAEYRTIIAQAEADKARDVADGASQSALEALAELAALREDVDAIDLKLAALDDRVTSNEESVEALMDIMAKSLSGSINRLAVEFEEELEVLGVRVEKLENLFASLSGRVSDLELQQKVTSVTLDRHFADHARAVQLSGKTEVKFEDTLVDPKEGVYAYKDLMDRDKDEVYEDETVFEQVYELTLSVRPTDNIEVEAGLEGTNVFNKEDADPFNLDGSYVQLSTDGVLKLMRFGTIPEQNWSPFTLEKYSEEADDEKWRDGMYAELEFPSNVTTKAVFERLVKDPDNDHDAYFGAVTTQWQVDKTMNLGVTFMTEADRIVKKEAFQDENTLWAFNAGLNLGNFSFAGEYAIDQFSGDAAAYELSASGKLGALNLGARVLDIGKDFLAKGEDELEASWKYGRSFDEDLAVEVESDEEGKPVDAFLKDDKPDNVEFARGLRNIEVDASMPAGSMTLGASYNKKTFTASPIVVKLDGDESKRLAWFKEAEQETEFEYDKRMLTAEMPVGRATLALEGGLGKELQGGDETVDAKYAQAALKNIPVVDGLTARVSAAMLRDTTDWYKESKWKAGEDRNKYKAGLAYDVTPNLNVTGSYELVRDPNASDEKDTKTVEATADYALSLGALNITQGLEFKKVLNDSRQMIAYRAGVGTTIFGADLGVDFLRRVGKADLEELYPDPEDVDPEDLDEEYDSIDTIWDVNLTYPVAENVDFKLGGLYVHHDNIFDRDEDDKKYSFTVKQVKAGLAISF